MKVRARVRVSADCFEALSVPHWPVFVLTARQCGSVAHIANARGQRAW